MSNTIEFLVAEIKALGYGLGRRLSVRFDGYCSGEGQCGPGEPPPPLFTLHAVLPYSPEYGTLQIGQRFELVRMRDAMDIAIDTLSNPPLKISADGLRRAEYHQ